MQSTEGRGHGPEQRLTHGTQGLMPVPRRRPESCSRRREEDEQPATDRLDATAHARAPQETGVIQSK